MDYSQFLVMHQEIGLLVLILLVFLFDTFISRTAPKGFTMFTVCLFGLLTALGFVFPIDKQVASAFGGMYVTSPVMIGIKNVLNIGVFIVILQSIKWADSEFMRVRRYVPHDFGSSLPAVHHRPRNGFSSACRSRGI